VRNSSLLKKIKRLNTEIYDPEVELKAEKKLQNKIVNLIQIRLSTNYKIQIHQNTKMRQDLNTNPSPFSSLIF